jgi:hypothetical protein
MDYTLMRKMRLPFIDSDYKTNRIIRGVKPRQILQTDR